MFTKFASTFRVVLASAFLLGFGAVIPAQAREVVVVREFPHRYRHVVVARHRYFRGVPVLRVYGPLYPGFGFFYTDAEARRFFGFTAWQLALFNSLDEAQLRAHEAALADATTAPVNESITWHDGPASGSVTALKEGHTPDGRECREFEQSVTIGDRNEQAHGTACLQRDGAWRMVNDASLG